MRTLQNVKNNFVLNLFKQQFKKKMLTKLSQYFEHFYVFYLYWKILKMTKKTKIKYCFVFVFKREASF